MTHKLLLRMGTGVVLLLGIMLVFFTGGAKAAGLSDILNDTSQPFTSFTYSDVSTIELVLDLKPGANVDVPPVIRLVAEADGNNNPVPRTYRTTTSLCTSDDKQSEFLYSSGGPGETEHRLVSVNFWLQTSGENICGQYFGAVEFTANIPPVSSLIGYYKQGDQIINAAGSQTFQVDDQNPLAFNLVNEGESCPAQITIDPGQSSTADVLTGKNQNRQERNNQCEAEGDSFNVRIANEGDLPENIELILSGATEFQPTCASEATNSGDELGWIGCAALENADRALRWIDGNIDSLLKVEESQYSNSNYRLIWTNLRNVSTVAIVGTAMFMVISTALDMGFFANYTVKKYLPRLVIGTIAIQLSWVLASLASSITNEIGDAIREIMISPFDDSVRDFSLASLFGASPDIDFGFADVGAGNAAGATAGVAVFAGATAVVSIGIFGTIVMAYSALGFLLFAYLFFVLRQMIIIVLILFSPVAVALWVLPGNDTAWNFYRKLFLALLVLYPVFITFITMGKILAYVTLQAGT